MPATRQPAASAADDDARISGAAAMIALGGHAVVILTALSLAGRTPQVAAPPNVVGVTLVSGEPGAAAPGPRRPALSPAQASSPSTAPPSEAVSTGERLDRLTDTATPSPISASAASAPGPGPGPPARAASGSEGQSGSSRANQGLRKGEGVHGVDLYAAASLPAVGVRPASPPTGDLWQRVAPCWRAAVPRTATLVVEVRVDGGLAAAPQAVRKAATAPDPLTLLAERAAVRALEACAPYTGLDARQWRVVFPG